MPEGEQGPCGSQADELTEMLSEGQGNIARNEEKEITTDVLVIFLGLGIGQSGVRSDRAAYQNKMVR